MSNRGDTNAMKYASYAFKFRLDPTAEQRRMCFSHAGSARWAYNFALDIKRQANQRYHTRRKALIDSGLSVEEATKAMRGQVEIPNAPQVSAMWRRCRGDAAAGVAGESTWWREVSSYAFSSGFRDADEAFKNYFDSRTGRRKGRVMGMPRFKSKTRSGDSFRIYHNVKRPTIRFEGYRRILIPRLGSVRTHDPRLAKKAARFIKRHGGHISSVAVSRAGDHWYASVLVNIPAESAPAASPTRRQHARGVVGVDLGVALMAATSDGELTDRLKPARDAHQRLLKAQRTLARTQKGSNRRRKAARRVGRLHHQVALKRAGAQHQFTTGLARSALIIVLEDLRVANMVRRPDPKLDDSDPTAGSVRYLPNGARAKAGLNRSILDVGWHEIRRQLEYKSTRNGATVAIVNAAYTSRTCSACGHVAAESRKSQAAFCCVNCGHAANADVNAAINIRDRYLGQPGAVGHTAQGTATVPAPQGVLAEAADHSARKLARESASTIREGPSRSTGGRIPPAFPNACRSTA